MCCCGACNSTTGSGAWCLFPRFHNRLPRSPTSLTDYFSRYFFSCTRRVLGRELQHTAGFREARFQCSAWRLTADDTAAPWPPARLLPAATMASTLRRPKKTLRNVGYAVGLLCFAGSFAVAPILMNRGRDNLTTSNKSLTGSQIMRGAYANTGSHDAGPDPDWVNGRYMGKGSDFNPTQEQLEEQRRRLEARLKELGLKKAREEEVK